MSLKDLTSYIISEKVRLEKAVGCKIDTFSYGPGVELTDNVSFLHKPLSFSPLTDTELTKLFIAVYLSGYRTVFSVVEYSNFMPCGLKLIDNFGRTGTRVIPLPHSYELVID